VKLARIKPNKPQHHTPFSDPEWFFELKYNGFRAICYFDGETCHLISYDGKRLNFPEVERDLKNLLGSRPFILDGELACFDGVHTVLEKIIRREPPFMYIAFDILYLDGIDLRSKPLMVRRKILQKFTGKKIMVSYGETGSGIDLYKRVCKKNQEGVVAKRLDGSYGSRWYKFLNPHYSQKDTGKRFIRKRVQKKK
jgi:bifunctional non-homologous end joining protein LigD